MSLIKSPRRGNKTLRVTGRKLAWTAPTSVRQAYRLEPDLVRRIVAMLSSDENREKLLNLHESFIPGAWSVGQSTEPGSAIGALSNCPSMLGVSQVALPRSIQRIGPYPLRRTQLVTFNFERDHVIAELREARDALGICGRGTDIESALTDLEREFDSLIRGRVRIPPHQLKPDDDALVAVIDYLVDWDRFNLENPLARALMGQLVRRDRTGRPWVKWTLGPAGNRAPRSMMVPSRYQHPRIQNFHIRDWFRAVVKEYPDRIEWLEPPERIPAPNDVLAWKAAWEAIPTIVADQENVWPLVTD